MPWLDVVLEFLETERKLEQRLNREGFGEAIQQDIQRSIERDNGDDGWDAS